MLFVLSGPSGVGKTTLGNALLERFPRFRLSVSHTTRPPRGKEQDGAHYHFVTDERFTELVEGGAFAEYAGVFGKRYGTAKETLEKLQQAEHDVLLDIDYQGAEQISRAYDDAVTVLVAPPSMEELEARLRGRATDSEQQIARRLTKAHLELSQYRVFSYLVVNGDIEAAITSLETIYLAERARVTRNIDFLENLVEPAVG